MFDTLTRIGASASGAYEIDRSLRFNRSDSANLTRTSSATSSTWTYSGWVKRSLFAQYQYLFSSGTEGFAFHATGETFYIYSSVNSTLVQSTASFRDPSAWYHVVVQMDSGTANAWINNVQTHTNAGGFALSTGSNETRIGSHASNNHHFDGYMAEIHFVDGQTLTPSSFAETDEDTGQWVPKKYAGSYGTDGFYLDFSDNSGTTATTLGKDKAGSNNFTPNNFSVAAGDGNDSKTDTPTSNKATISSLTPHWTDTATVSDGNLKLSGSAGFKNISTIAFDGTSKFYYESVRTSAAGWQLLGVFIGETDNPSNAVLHSQIYGFASTAALYEGGSYSASGAPSWGNDDVMGLKYNNGTLQIYKNGTLHGTSITGIPTTKLTFAYIANDNTSSTSYMRFSSGDWTQATAASVDDTWELSQANLSDPTIKKSTDHFDVKLWSGNAGTQNITGLSFQPDFVWNKCRSAGHDHQMWDAVRGVTKSLRQDTESEATHTDGLTAFNSDGITWGLNSRNNGSGQTYAGFFWDEVASAGFDIVSYTGNGSARTISHSLGVVPEMMIIKRRDSADNWMVYHKTEGNTKYYKLNSTAGSTD